MLSIYMSEALILIFTGKLNGSVYFSPALQPHFMCVELKSDRVGLEVQATWFGEHRKSPFFQNIRFGDSPSYAVGDALWQLERTPSRSDFLKFAQAEWTRTYRDNASARAALFTRVQSRKAKF